MASGVKVRPRLPSLSAVTDSLLSPTLNMQALCLQFSTSWTEPHFEKPLVTQAQAIQIYSRAYGEWHSPEDLAAAQNIQGYIRHFLTNSDGAFYVGQGGDVVSARDSVLIPTFDRFPPNRHVINDLLTRPLHPFFRGPSGRDGDRQHQC
jgi:hypothetical protein